VGYRAAPGRRPGRWVVPVAVLLALLGVGALFNYYYLCNLAVYNCPADGCGNVPAQNCANAGLLFEATVPLVVLGLAALALLRRRWGDPAVSRAPSGR